MKKLILTIIAVTLMAGSAFADTYVRGYYRSNGTYVAPHYRSSPNSTTYDNWSTKGNRNPYTGQYGTKNPTTSNPFRSTYRPVRSQYGF